MSNIKHTTYTVERLQVTRVFSDGHYGRMQTWVPVAERIEDRAEAEELAHRELEREDGYVRVATVNYAFVPSFARA